MEHRPSLAAGWTIPAMLTSWLSHVRTTKDSCNLENSDSVRRVVQAKGRAEPLEFLQGIEQSCQ